ncbi:hypothetical protein FB478_11062 [Arthrobacter sp. AG367]|jgi:hypothetical protein|uniref:hypothetical protein n=1 Tax=Arthrobacter sp. AG367 TaxID=2572909 RepID=UPI00119DB0AC|nr:hypothetical protein [Arthrobacter sp. AG367]TWD48364.1 hypothetical protein FB478_11062 [Arthrobacter sp. AG367]
MDAAADQPPSGRIRPGTSSQDRVFHAFRRWPLVPAADLLLLRHALVGQDSSTEPDHASALRCLVDDELTRRLALPPASGD